MLTRPTILGPLIDVADHIDTDCSDEQPANQVSLRRKAHDPTVTGYVTTGRVSAGVTIGHRESDHRPRRARGNRMMLKPRRIAPRPEDGIMSGAGSSRNDRQRFHVRRHDASNALTLTSITTPSGIQFSGLTKETVIPAAKAVSGTASGLSLSLASFPVSLVATWASGETAPNSATVKRPVESCAPTSTTARSTAAPTTAAPATAAPTTAAPTTAASTTAAPTTVASTAAVVVPTTQSGVLGASIVAAPVTLAPARSLPKTGSHTGPLAFVGLAMTVVGLTLVRLGRSSEQSAN